MPPELRIRPYELTDLSALQRIRQAAFAPVFRSFRALVGEAIAVHAFARADDEQAKLLDDLCRRAPNRLMLVAALGSEPVGFVSYSTDPDSKVGEIGLNAVHPEHAGKGIGTLMYRHVLERMKESGMAVAAVGTGGDASHAAARCAYAKAGFGPGLPSIHLYKKL